MHRRLERIKETSDDPKLWLGHAKKERLVVLEHCEGGKVLDIDVACERALVFDVDPDEAAIRPLRPEGRKGCRELAAGGAPCRAKTNHDERVPCRVLL